MFCFFKKECQNDFLLYYIYLSYRHNLDIKYPFISIFIVVAALINNIIECLLHYNVKI